MTKAEYEKIANTSMSNEEFLILLILLPVFAIAHADGEYDELEKNAMHELIGGLVSEVYSELDKKSIETMITAYEQDFNFIFRNQYLEKELLQELRRETQMIDGLANQVNSFMNEIASASKGISDLEQNKIDEVNDLLNT
ncbi:MAG: hypothetical protein RIA69_17755 [Cyclobacteriaceae bacterium]